MAFRMSSLQYMTNYRTSLNKMYQNQAKLFEQADGSTIHRGSDDPVGYSKLLRYKTSDVENTQYQQNVNTGISWMSTSDDAITLMGEIMQTFKAKTIEAGTDTNTESDFHSIAKEMLAEIQQIVSSSNEQQGDRYIFAGQMDTTQPFTLSNTTYERGLAKTLDSDQAAFFKGSTGDVNATLYQMLTLDFEGKSYYLDTQSGYVYDKEFVEEGYKDLVANGYNSVTDKIRPELKSIEQVYSVGGVNSMTVDEAWDIVNAATEKELMTAIQDTDIQNSTTVNAELKRALKYLYDNDWAKVQSDVSTAQASIVDSLTNQTPLDLTYSDVTYSYTYVYSYSYDNYVTRNIGNTTYFEYSGVDGDGNTQTLYKRSLTDSQYYTALGTTINPSYTLSPVTTTTTVTKTGTGTYTTSDISGSETELQTQLATVTNELQTQGSDRWKAIRAAHDAEIQAAIDSDATRIKASQYYISSSDLTSTPYTYNFNIAVDKLDYETTEYSHVDWSTYNNTDTTLNRSSTGSVWNSGVGKQSFVGDMTSAIEAYSKGLYTVSNGEYIQPENYYNSDTTYTYTYATDGSVASTTTVSTAAGIAGDDAAASVMNTVQAFNPAMGSDTLVKNVTQDQLTNLAVKEEIYLAIKNYADYKYSAFKVADAFTNQGLTREDVENNDRVTDVLNYSLNNAGNYTVDSIRIKMKDNPLNQDDDPDNDAYENFNFTKISQRMITYNGDANYISMVKLNGATDATSDIVNLTGQDLYGNDIFDNSYSGNTQSGSAMLNNMLTVYTKTDACDTRWLISDGVTLSDVSHSTLTVSQTTLGARLQLYTGVKDMLQNQNDDITEDITNISGTDVALLATKLMEMTTLYNMSLSLGGRILPQSLADYL